MSESDRKLRQANTYAAGLLWTALEDDLPGLKEAARISQPSAGYAYRAVKVGVGDYSAGGGEISADIHVDMVTGRRIIAEAERIIRERMVELGQLDISEINPAFRARLAEKTPNK